MMIHRPNTTDGEHASSSLGSTRYHSDLASAIKWKVSPLTPTFMGVGFGFWVRRGFRVGLGLKPLSRLKTGNP